MDICKSASLTPVGTYVEEYKGRGVPLRRPIAPKAEYSMPSGAIRETVFAQLVHKKEVERLRTIF